MAKKPEAPTAALTIVCRTPGFRRAGIAHPDRADYPAGTFTAEQLEALRAEPLLTVIEAGGEAGRLAPSAAGAAEGAA